SNHITNITITIDGDAASCESYYSGFMLECHDDGEHRTMQMLGRYLDRLERRDGEWKISDRRVVTEMYRYLPPDGDVAAPHLHLDTREVPDPSYALLAARWAGALIHDDYPRAVLVRIRLHESRSLATPVCGPVRGAPRLHRVYRESRFRRHLARRAPRHRRWLSPVPVGGRCRGRGAYAHDADLDRCRARAALPPRPARRG